MKNQKVLRAAVWLLAVLLALCLTACGWTEEVQHYGVNVRVVSVDAAACTLTVEDCDEGRTGLGAPAVLNCRETPLFYVDYATDAEQELSLSQLLPGDELALGVAESQLQAWRDGAPELELLQIQLTTQRLRVPQ